VIDFQPIFNKNLDVLFVLHKTIKHIMIKEIFLYRSLSLLLKQKWENFCFS